MASAGALHFIWCNCFTADHLPMQIHISPEQSGPLLFVRTLSSIYRPERSPGYSRTRPQRTCRKTASMQRCISLRAPVTGVVLSVWFTSGVWRRMWLCLWEGQGCKDLHSSLWYSTQWLHRTSHLWKRHYPRSKGFLVSKLSCMIVFRFYYFV